MAEIGQIWHHPIDQRRMQQRLHHAHAANDEAGIVPQRVDAADHLHDIARIHLRQSVDIVFHIQQSDPVNAAQLTDEALIADPLLEQDIHHDLLIHA